MNSDCLERFQSIVNSTYAVNISCEIKGCEQKENKFTKTIVI